MKYVSFISTFILTVVFSPLFAQFDDIYFNPDEDEDIYAYYHHNRDAYTYNQEDSYSEDYQYEEDRFDESDSHYDFYYTSRIRRFHRPYFGFGFFANPYVDLFYYDPFYFDPFRPSVSIYMGSFPYYNPWNTWNSWNTWGYNPFWPGGFGNNYFINNYYGFNPYYYNPYQPFGPPNHWNYADDFYGNNNNYYYGPRNAGHGRTHATSRINPEPDKVINPENDSRYRSRESDRTETPAVKMPEPTERRIKRNTSPKTNDTPSPSTRRSRDTRSTPPRTGGQQDNQSYRRPNTYNNNNNYRPSRPDNTPTYNRNTPSSSTPSSNSPSRTPRSSGGRSRGGQ